ncbi:MAG TPA: septal ring lytic transglycosylase RlpA family protein [Aquifex aeolicus]|nr:septal ring lytic transglycosylase RlpA family protein [Aquifex aeolicus]
MIVLLFLLFMILSASFGSEGLVAFPERKGNLPEEIEEFVEVAPGLEVRKGCKVEKGIASWYGGRFHGRRTANGEIYDLFKFTAASRTLPLGTYVLVRNEENGRVITVRINDRGPYVGGRIIDLSQASAYKLGMMYDGVAMVQVIPLRCLSPRSLLRFYDEIILDIANTM